MRFIATIIVALCFAGCGATVASVDVIRDECLRSGGVFHVTYSDYLSGWRPDKANCWYGVKAEDLERVKALDE